MANNKVPAAAFPVASFAAGAKIAAGITGSIPNEKVPVVTGALSYTTFATSVTKLILSSPPDAYIQARLMLETAGPVAWGYLEAITPVTSGKGRLLIQNVEQIVELPPATRLYIASLSPQRIGISVAPYPFLQELLSAVRALGKK